MVAWVLADLESRSRSEQDELERLRAAGGSALRERAGEFMLDVGPEVGLFLNSVARAMRAQVVVEVGGSVGYSTLWLADAVRDNGGRVYSIEVDPRKQRQQWAYLCAAGLHAVVEQTPLEVGDLLPCLPQPVDLVLLDHWKELYIRDFEFCWPALRPGGVVVADNILRPTKNLPVIAEYRRRISKVPDAQSQVLDLGDGLELTVKRERFPAP